MTESDTMVGAGEVTELHLPPTRQHLKEEVLETVTTTGQVVPGEVTSSPLVDQPLEVQEDEAISSLGRTSTVTTLEKPMYMIYGTHCVAPLALRFPLGVNRSALPVGGRLKHFLKQWKEITSDKWVLDVISKGLSLNFKGSLPPLSSVPKEIHLPKDPEKRRILLQAVDEMVEKAAVSKCQEVEPAFFAHLFVVPKLTSGWRPVIDLHVLNRFLAVPHFKMETVHSIRAQLHQGEYVVVLDLQDAYFHIPIRKTFQKFLKFCILGVVYKFVALCFGLSTAPRAFTMVMRAVVKYLRELGMLIHAYLDDWLLRNRDPALLLAQLEKVLQLLNRLGILVNFQKSVLEPRQRFVYLGTKFDLVRALVFPTEEALGKLQIWLQFFQESNVAPARAFLSFLGLLNHIADLVPLGRLHVRPVQ